MKARMKAKKFNGEKSDFKQSLSKNTYSENSYC